MLLDRRFGRVIKVPSVLGTPLAIPMIVTNAIWNRWYGSPAMDVIPALPSYAGVRRGLTWGFELGKHFELKDHDVFSNLEQPAWVWRDGV